jgi:5-methylcytosine-specific restriction endonuclease McrA
MNYAYIISRMKRDGASPDNILDEIVRLEKIPRWHVVRRAVLRRDGSVCRYCGSETDKPDVDHVIPRYEGGTNEIDNLVVACATCNRSKGKRTPDAWLQKPQGV